jgi:hypothetical protein
MQRLLQSIEAEVPRARFVHADERAVVSGRPGQRHEVAVLVEALVRRPDGEESACRARHRLPGAIDTVRSTGRGMPG